MSVAPGTVLWRTEILEIELSTLLSGTDQRLHTLPGTVRMKVPVVQTDTKPNARVHIRARFQNSRFGQLEAQVHEYRPSTVD